jgi:hypothetical protein
VFVLVEAGAARKRGEQDARGSGAREDGERLHQRSMSEYEVVKRNKTRTWRRVSTALVTTTPFFSSSSCACRPYLKSQCHRI